MAKEQFDYEVQVWHVDGIVLDCGHTDDFRERRGGKCCNAHLYAGRTLEQAIGDVRRLRAGANWLA